MRYHVLATDYDGTLAHHGRVDDATLAALERLLASGRRLVMVTGRELPELREVLPKLDLFHWIVAENGALQYCPATNEEKLLADPPPARFVDALRAAGVDRVSVGRVIVATWQPYEKKVLAVIRDQGLERQVIFNKGAVMVLPTGVNKATGLAAALYEMGLSPHNVVGVGDAENDHAFLQYCEVSAAVANALSAVKETADVALARDHGAGVTQLIDRLIADDLASFEKRLTRRRLKFAHVGDEEVTLPAHGPVILICGPSASGKSSLVQRLVESLAECRYQFCLFDPEGDFEALEHAVVLGGAEGPPPESEVLQLLKNSDSSAAISLTGMHIPDRPPYFLKLLASLNQLRTGSGRPHWLILDEAHHLLPADWQPPADILPEHVHSVVLVTVHPDHLSPTVMKRVDTLMIVGERADETLATFCRAAGIEAPRLKDPALAPGELWLWSMSTSEPPRKVTAHAAKEVVRRHQRQYIEGELPPERSFYFRGPQKKLNLRAPNLTLFLQLADGVDDDTWEYHRRRGDYSHWFRTCIKDRELATTAEQIERLEGAAPAQTRQLMRDAVQRLYMADAPSPVALPGAS